MINKLLTLPNFTTIRFVGYSVSTGAKSPVGSRKPVNQEAYSRFIENVTFFVPVIISYVKSSSLWALFRAEASQDVDGRHLLGTGQPVDGIANSIQYPPFSHRNELLGIQLIQQEGDCYA